MDVQALDSVVTVLPRTNPAQSQNQDVNAPPQSSAVNSSTQPADGTKPVSPASETSNTTHAPATVADYSVHASYKYVTNPVQVVVVFTAADGQVVGQAPPAALVKLVQFDHGSGELVDRNV